MLLVILLASIAASIFGYIYRDQVDSGLTDGLKEAMDHYGLPNGTVWTQEIDFMQTEVHSLEDKITGRILGLCPANERR